ncbi:hypothetical protein [Kineosporia babensis]|uniref:DUF3558 domain-containing protein n=1 Tax=Kineosporia babensis TaxID=499548 RepID=A0A9X1SSU9_9ACTN|nr:hypothetical protein [Kineosporia babensis]MCD5310721.1 hypothetical protein [Kineosporia babensis]
MPTPQRSGPRRTHCLRPLTVLAALTVLAGCSSGSSTADASSPVPSSSTQPSTTGEPASSAPTIETDVTPQETRTAGETESTKGEATCAGLSADRVGKLLETSIEAGIPDERTGTEGQRQLDGCSYTGAGGIQLGYLIWQVAVSGNRDLVEQGLPPKDAGATTFKPGLGKVSAGSVITTGPIATAQVNVFKRKRLVQVSATAKTAKVARSAATAVAAELIG